MDEEGWYERVRGLYEPFHGKRPSLSGRLFVVTSITESVKSKIQCV
jgi:hypothetical protein